jgi:uncharacterized membrane protein YraQ (UPF0718 family)
VAALSLGAATTVFARSGFGRVGEIFLKDLWLFATILPKVAAGCLIGALVRVLVPRETIVRLVGEGSGLKGLALAAGVGAIFPGGPFTIFPLAGMFLLAGADRGAAVAFITGWLLLGINRAIVWEAPFFGGDVVLYRTALSVPLPIVAGFAARRIDPLVTGGKPRPTTERAP